MVMFEEYMIWLYGSLALFVWACLWLFETRPNDAVFPAEWVCDGCGQVCSHLHDGLCEYCDKVFTPTSKKL